MAADVRSSSRPFILRARRDTVALVAVTLALTGGLASAIHANRTTGTAQAAVWTGDLADAPTDPAPASKPVLTSASLVVPASDLALPKVPPRAKIKSCGATPCQAKTAAVLAEPAPRRMAALESEPPARVTSGDEAVTYALRPPADVGPSRPGLMARLNPLRHLPDLATVRRPLNVANETISGWFKRL